jgi:hypothetical protein
MTWWFWILPGVAGLLGVAILVGGARTLARGRPLRGGRGMLGGGALLGLAGAGALLGLNIQTYNRLTYERPIAQIAFVEVAPQRFTATLTEPGQAPQTFDMNGDQWRVEARVLRWRPWANVLGLDAQYRLERLSGRYEDLGQELGDTRSAYAIGGQGALADTIDLWRLARAGVSFLPAADTVYGGGVYMPMADGAAFEVSLTQTGLIARPVYQAADRAAAQ